MSLFCVSLSYKYQICENVFQCFATCLLIQPQQHVVEFSLMGIHTSSVPWRKAGMNKRNTAALTESLTGCHHEDRRLLQTPTTNNLFPSTCFPDTMIRSAWKACPAPDWHHCFADYRHFIYFRFLSDRLLCCRLPAYHPPFLCLLSLPTILSAWKCQRLLPAGPHD